MGEMSHQLSTHYSGSVSEMPMEFETRFLGRCFAWASVRPMQGCEFRMLERIQRHNPADYFAGLTTDGIFLHKQTPLWV